MFEMKRRPITQLENQLEQFIEGSFARLFSRRIQAQDIALKLTRAMEDHTNPASGTDPRDFAPDRYTIYTHPDVQNHLLTKHPDMCEILSTHMTELAMQLGYRLKNIPVIEILSDRKLPTNGVLVTAQHQDSTGNSTAAMQSVEITTVSKPENCQLIIDQNRTVELDVDIINVGRHPENQIILDDNHVSRHHLQLRLRQGIYILFDVGSQSGTYVNGIRIKQHPLKSGDIIRIGKTHILYLEGDGTSEPEHDDQPTDSFEPPL